MLPLQNQINLLRRIYEEASASFEIEDNLSPSAIENHESLKSPTSAKEFRELQLFDISYSYPGAANNALRDITASIYKGDFIALVGKSGSGKSTFADIVAGLRAPASGVRQVISSDGTTDSSLIFGYVPQKITLFSGSLRQNIAMSFDDAEIDEERLSNSINLANLAKLVRHLPEGVRTQVDDSNRGLSGGEVQRVGIARALYAGAEFIVMDESTSALDRASEDAILETLLGLKNKATVVLIAHREKSVAIADRILVFENGRILDSESK
jgi:ABC-type multidrug transport system fused ATPase/permease subunit